MHAHVFESSQPAGSYVGHLLYSQSWLSKVAATFLIEQNQADKVSFNHIV